MGFKEAWNQGSYFIKSLWLCQLEVASAKDEEDKERWPGKVVGVGR